MDFAEEITYVPVTDKIFFNLLTELNFLWISVKLTIIYISM